jgi:CelD/BcsL family acetyltransferase involved in cellulose biosynthesis
MQEQFTLAQGVVVSPLDDPRWTAFVDAHPESLPFHHPAWASVLADAYGFEAGALALVGDDEIECGLPVIFLGRRSSRIVSLPFTDWIPPLSRPGVDAALMAARIEAARSEAALASIEIRDDLGPSTGYIETAGHRHLLPLSREPAEVFAGLHKSPVKALRLSERRGVSVRRSHSCGELLDVFYPLHVTTRRRLGVPVQPRRFFRTLGESFLEAGLGLVVSAYSEGAPLSSAVFLTWNGRMIYKYSATSDAGRRVGAAHAALWDAIRWGCENGYVEFDFGRTERGHEGLRQFKRNWGGQELNLKYTHFADRAPRRGNGRTAELLASVIRRSPEFVARAIGRVAYRYTA